MLTTEQRKAIINRDKKCRKCGSIENLTVDHIIPIIRGGTDAQTNLQTLCFNCNQQKGYFSQLSIVQRIRKWLFCEEMILKVEYDLKGSLSSLNTQFNKLQTFTNDLSSKVGQIKLPDVSAILSKAEQALSTSHLQTNRITELEARLHLLEQHLKLELVEETKRVEHVIVEDVKIKKFRKVK